MIILVRLTGMAVAGVAGWQLGMALAASSQAMPPGEALRYVLLLAVAGGGLGLLLTPYATVVPLRWIWRKARTADADDVLGGTVGLLVGLLGATLAAFPLSQLPDPIGRWLPAVVAVLLAWLGTAIGMDRKQELVGAVRAGWSEARSEGGLRGAALLDTSSIVDGRIVEIRLCGFIGGRLVVPRFVLEELQQLGDAGDPARRQRGRRGLDMLERLQRDVPVAVLDTDFADLRGVDSKLIRLARQQRAAIVTCDYNLNRVASLQGVPVLNINDLANALRPVLVPGEEVMLEVVQEGRERGQGVGYLDDGTMVVVEGGRRFVGERVAIDVTRVLPTAGGRIVFARPRVAGAAPGTPGAEPAGDGTAKGAADGADVAPDGPAPGGERARLRVVRHAGGGQ
jgi:uncharacterized protein YacL